MMHAFAESDESTDSDDNEDSSIITHSRVEPLNWYIANREWSMGHVSREANRPPPHAHRYENQQDDDELSDSQECAELLRKKCHRRDGKKKRLNKCCTCCCRKTSGASIVDDRNEAKGTRTKAATKKHVSHKTSPNDEEKLSKEMKIYDKKKAAKAREKEKKKRSKQKSKSGKKHRGKTEDELLSEMLTAGASADITKSCCYLCAQNSMAIIAARVPRPTEQLTTRGTQFSEKPQVRTVQSSVKVRTCDRSTDCPRSNGLKRKKFKLKSFKALSKYVKKMWPNEKTVACGSNTSIKKRTKKMCGTKECRRYASSNL